MLEPTKTYKYLFEPFLKIFHTQKIRDVFDTYKTGVKIVNVFLEDLGINKYKFTDGILHVVCHIADKKSLEHIRSLSIGKQGHHYIDSYMIHHNPSVIVIQFKAMRGTAFQHFLHSDYKNMFSKTMLDDLDIKSRFIRGKNKKGDLIYTKPYRVFIDDPKLRTSLAKRVGVDEDELKQLASKLNFDHEIVNIRKYIEDVQGNL